MYRCTKCSKPIESTFAGPQGQCWPCKYGEQDISPQQRIEAVALYFPVEDWGKADGPVIDELEAFGQEILDAKDTEHTEKMVGILRYGIEDRGFDNYDVVMVPPSSSNLNHMIPKARRIEELYDIPFEDAIIELDETGEMKKKTLEERRESAEDNYLCQANVQGERVLLLDDVIASTSTITGVASAVAAKGASQVATVAMSRSVDLYDLKDKDLVVKS